MSRLRVDWLLRVHCVALSATKTIQHVVPAQTPVLTSCSAKKRTRHPPVKPVKAAMPNAVIIGYGPGVASGVLASFIGGGFTVAIVARSLSRLEAVAGAW